MVLMDGTCLFSGVGRKEEEVVSVEAGERMKKETEGAVEVKILNHFNEEKVVLTLDLVLTKARKGAMITYQRYKNGERTIIKLRLEIITAKIVPERRLQGA